MAGPLKSSLSGVTVVLPAGGRGERLAALAKSQNINKAALKIGKHSLIERTLLMYVEAGVKLFVVLTGHRADSVRNALGDGHRWRVAIKYSQDPPVPLGKGGAIRLALESGAIPSDAPFIVHNPDDQIVAIGKKFPGFVWKQHQSFERKGAYVTAVCVPDTEYPFSAFKAGSDGLALSAVMYPRVKMPTHIGVTIVSPEAVPDFCRLIPLNKKSDFESVVLPRLARRRQLGLAMIPTGCWYPVNDLKGYKALLEAL